MRFAVQASFPARPGEEKPLAERWRRGAGTGSRRRVRSTQREKGITSRGEGGSGDGPVHSVFPFPFFLTCGP